MMHSNLAAPKPITTMPITIEHWPTQKAVAYKILYDQKPRLKLGESPKRVKLGSVLFPIGEGIEFGEARAREAFPEANTCRLYNEHGHFFCSTST